MRIRNLWILGLIVLVSACSGVNVKSDSDIAVRQNGHPFAYWFVTTGGCSLADENAVDNYYTYEWSGRCENGFVTGCGQLLLRSVAAKGAVIQRIDGCFYKGLKSGKFNMSLPLSSEGAVFKIEYVEGLAISYTKVSPSPPPLPQRLPDDPKTVGRGARGG